MAKNDKIQPDRKLCTVSRLRIVRERKTVRGAAPEGTKSVKPGYEDLLLVLIVAILLVGWGTKQLTIEQVLTYLGAGTTGGVWGLIGGSASGT